MEAKTLAIILGNPTPEEVETRVRSAQAEYLGSKDPEKRNVLMEVMQGLLGIQRLTEEQGEIAVAKTAVSRAAAQLSELKEKLLANEQVVCEQYNGKNTVKWEIIGQNGEALGNMEDPSAIARIAKFDGKLLERIANGDRAALREIKKAAKDITARKARMESLRSLVDHVSRMVAEGTELIVGKGSAKVVTDTRAIRQEINARLKLIVAGRTTMFDTKTGKMAVDGKEVLSFTI
jgi:hypothetical protein